MSGIDHIFSVYAADGLTVNGALGDSGDFINVANIHTIEFTPGSLSTLTITDNYGDGYLHADNYRNERSDDQNMQTSDGIDTYVDYEIVFSDPDGNLYTVYVIDVGESPTAHPADNQATSYLAFDPDNPPPEGVELECVSWKQTPKLAYEDFEVPCFAEGTELVMADGTRKTVEDIVMGDIVSTISGPRPVVWAGHSIERDDLYSIRHPEWSKAVTVTKNHGIAVKNLDGKNVLAAAKFLTEAQYGDFMVSRVTGHATRVFHIMLDAHDLLITGDGLYSESYFVGGWDTIPEAEDAFKAATGLDEMELILPRLKRRDAADVLELKMVVAWSAAA